jgi:glutaredoxin
VYNLDEDFSRDEFYSEFGSGSTFPQVVLNDQEHIGGCTDTVKYLKENKVI